MSPISVAYREDTHKTKKKQMYLYIEFGMSIIMLSHRIN